jgi:hypothetical protein
MGEARVEREDVEDDEVNSLGETKAGPRLGSGQSNLAHTLYALLVVLPPRPVQFVWKNSPRGLSMRS